MGPRAFMDCLTFRFHTAFSALTLLVGRQEGQTHVGFRAHVKIASRIVSCRAPRDFRFGARVDHLQN